MVGMGKHIFFWALQQLEREKGRGIWTICQDRIYRDKLVLLYGMLFLKGM